MVLHCWFRRAVYISQDTYTSYLSILRAKQKKTTLYEVRIGLYWSILGLHFVTQKEIIALFLLLFQFSYLVIPKMGSIRGT